MENPEFKQKAEISIQKAKELILRSIPKDEIICIYIKGSYVRNELLADSDIDVVVILKDDTHLNDLYTLPDGNNTVDFPFQIAGYTLDELKTGEWSTKRPKNTSPISTFVKQINSFPIIYGAKPEGELFTRTDLKDLTALLKHFQNAHMEDYYDGKLKFSHLVKQVFWLVEREQRVLGHMPDYSWTKLADLVNNKSHIVNDALRLRNQAEITKADEDAFITKLKEYLDFLENKYLKV